MVREYKKIVPARLAFFIAIALPGYCENALSRDLFNPELVELDNPGEGKVDLSHFDAGAQAPGTYHVDIFLNDGWLEAADVTFSTTADAEGNEKLEPCLTVEQLSRWGVKTDLFPALGAKNTCAKLEAIPQASTAFQFGQQRLDVSIPQAALSAQARGYVPPEQWDDGIAAAMLNYSLSGGNSWGRNAKSGDTQSQYANLRPGVNLGPWRVRNYLTWTRDAGGQNKWDTVYTYAQRAITPLKAELTLGDSSAPAEVFDSMPFRGVQLASDDDMLPDSLKGYAPAVRGIARTHAQVIIRQNGYQIYQSFVAPGAFDITDLYPTGGAGDLDVTVKEADGSEQRFTVPYASLPVLQREGHLKYALTAGQYRSYNSQVQKTPFGQLTGIIGLPYGLTLYGGVQTAADYRALSAGAGKNMGDMGAFSVDVTQARATPQDRQTSRGQSWRARYSKNIVATGTQFSIAGYRYSTRGFYAMQDVLDSYGDGSALHDRRRNRAELTMSQSLGDGLGAVMLSAAREDYWNGERPMASWSLSYNNAWRRINYGLSATLSRNGGGTNTGTDRLLAVNISIPLDAFGPQTWASYGLGTSRNGDTTQNVGVSGVALAGNALNWNVQQGYGTSGVGYAGNVNGDYKGTYGEVTAGYSYDRNSERLSYGVQGGVLAHADGVTFSQPLGETNVLIRAPGAAGVGIQNMTGVQTDYRGYTLASNLMPFRKNDIGLITDTLPGNVEIEQTVKTVVPTRGAIVRADYASHVGIRLLLTLTQPDGRAVPFGAMASVEGEQGNGFIVGSSGQVYLSGLAPEVTLRVKWGDEKNQSCRAHYVVAQREQQNDIVRASAACR